MASEIFFLIRAIILARVVGLGGKKVIWYYKSYGVWYNL